MNNEHNEMPEIEKFTNGEEVKKDLKGLIGSITKFFSDLLDIRNNTDQEATKAAIIADIPFKGHTSWILICSIFVASVGLNANSTAVVIGAMLISPLLGPILGMGLSLATNDIDTLRRSLKNFAVMVGLSVFTAFLFFYFFPLRDESSELLARTAPDIRDVLIAFFGGLALVIARAKKGTIASVIYGVAIATALMPPLCTVGFGLAIGNFSYAIGALYLFIINTIFIGLATFLVLRLLKLPMVRYANSRRRRFIARIASVVAILVMIPAGFTFYNVFQESRFMIQSQQLINETIGAYQFKSGGKYLDELTKIEYKRKGTSKIELVSLGDEPIPENVIDSWRAQKAKYSKLGDTEINIVQAGKDDSEIKFNYVNELYESKKAEISSKDERIKLLEEALGNLGQLSIQVPFNEISAEAKTNYENLERLSFSPTIRTDFAKIDTIPVFEIKWKSSVNKNQMEADTKKLTDWLRLRLKNDKIQLKQEIN